MAQKGRAQHKHDHLGRRHLARQAPDAFLPHAGQNQRLARRKGHAAAENFRIGQAFQGRDGKIARAHRTAAREQQHVHIGQVFPQSNSNGFQVVGHNAQQARLGPGFAADGRQGVAVHVAHLAGPGIGADRNDLVAGGKDAHPGPGAHAHASRAAGGQQSDFLRAEQNAGSERRAALTRVVAAPQHMRARSHGPPDFHQGLPILAVGQFGTVLHHDHGVGPVRQRAAGDDGRASARLQTEVGRAVHGDAAREGQIDRIALGRAENVRRLHGIAVHAGAAGQGHVVPGNDVRRQHPAFQAARVGQGRRFGGQGGKGRQAAGHFRHGQDHKKVSGHGSSSHPPVYSIPGGPAIRARQCFIPAGQCISPHRPRPTRSAGGSSDHNRKRRRACAAPSRQQP